MFFHAKTWCLFATCSSKLFLIRLKSAANQFLKRGFSLSDVLLITIITQNGINNFLCFFTIRSLGFAKIWPNVKRGFWAFYVEILLPKMLLIGSITPWIYWTTAKPRHPRTFALTIASGLHCIKPCRLVSQSNGIRAGRILTRSRCAYRHAQGKYLYLSTV